MRKLNAYKAMLQSTYICVEKILGSNLGSKEAKTAKTMLYRFGIAVLMALHFLVAKRRELV